MCVHIVSPKAAFETVNNLKFGRLESKSRSINTKFRPPGPTNILSKYLAVYPPLLLMWASAVTPTLCIVRCFVSRLLEPTSLAAPTLHFVHLVKHSSVRRSPNKIHMYSYVQSYNTLLLAYAYSKPYADYFYAMVSHFDIMNCVGSQSG